MRLTVPEQSRNQPHPGRDRGPENRPIRRWEISVLCVLACLLFGLRLLDLNSAPFINDEPAIQSLLDGHLRAGTIPTQGLGGSRGLMYGPAPFWFYLPVRLVTDDVGWIITEHTLSFGVAFALFFAAARRVVGIDVAAWAVVLLSSSPLLVFYSRTAWDNPLLVVTSALMLWVLVRLDTRGGLSERQSGHRVVLSGLLGVACGLVFSVHLMTIPVLAAASIVFMLHVLPLRSRALAGALFSFIIAGVAVNAVYLHHLLAALVNREPVAWRLDVPFSLARTSLEAADAFLSPSAMHYFFDAPSDPVPQTAPVLAALMRLHPAVPLELAAAVCLLAAAWRFRAQCTLTQCGVALFFAWLAYYWLLRPDLVHPHYFLPAWWLGPYFAALAIARSPRTIRIVLKVAAWVVVLTNTLYILDAHAYIVRHGGTRGVHYGTVQVNIRNAVAELCRRLPGGEASAALDITPATGVMTPSISYFFNHVPECRGKQLIFTAPDRAAFALFYDDGATADALLHVAYQQGSDPADPSSAPRGSSGRQPSTLCYEASELPPPLLQTVVSHRDTPLHATSERPVSLPIRLDYDEVVVGLFEGSLVSPLTREMASTLTVTVDDEVAVFVNDDAVLEAYGFRGPTTFTRSVMLPQDTHRIRIFYSNLHTLGTLSVSHQLEGGDPVPWGCGTERLALCYREVKVPSYTRFLREHYVRWAGCDQPRSLPVEFTFDRPTMVHLSGVFANPSPEPLRTRLNLVFNDEILVWLNGELLTSTDGRQGGTGRSLLLNLRPGDNRLEIDYTNLAAAGVLRLSTLTIEGQPVPWNCRPCPTAP